MTFLLPILLIAVIWSWPALWFRLVRNKIDVEVSVHRTQVDYGEVVPVTVTIRNRSWLPCPSIEVVIDLPGGLSAKLDRPERIVRWKTYLIMRQELTAQLQCYAVRRGLYQFGHRDVVIYLNEGFGLRDLYLRRPMEQEIVVLPKRTSFAQVNPVMNAIMGDLEVRRWLHPDEAMLRGIRQFQNGDSHRHIAWQATARTGEWMTKEFSTTTEIVVTLMVNAQFHDQHWMGSDTDVFDDMCSAARAVAADLTRRRIPMVFAGNGTSPRMPLKRWYGEQPAHGINVLLGRFNSIPNGDFSLVLNTMPKELKSQAPLVIVSAHLTQPQLRILQQFARRGSSIFVVWFGEPDMENRLRALGIHVVTGRRDDSRTTPVEEEVDLHAQSVHAQ